MSLIAMVPVARQQMLLQPMTLSKQAGITHRGGDVDAFIQDAREAIVVGLDVFALTG